MLGTKEDKKKKKDDCSGYNDHLSAKNGLSALDKKEKTTAKFKKKYTVMRCQGQ